MARKNYQIEKQRLLQALVDVRQRIFNRCRPLDRAIVVTPFLGHWSIMELLAHLSGWDLANKEAAEAILAGRLPAFYQHHDQDWRTFNQILVQRHLKAEFESLLASVEGTHQSLIIFLETIPAGEFYKDRGLRFKGYKVLLSRLVAAEAEDEADHLEQIETFLARSQLNGL